MLRYNRILAPIDFAEISYSTLKQASIHSEESQSEFIVAHIVDQDGARRSEKDENTHTSIKNLVKQAELHVNVLLDELEIGYAETMVRAGPTVDTLLEVIAEKEVDLVVMGTHHHQAVAERARSVTLAIIEKVDCDVLVLHK